MKISSRQSKPTSRSILRFEVAGRPVTKKDENPLSRLSAGESVYQIDLIEVARKSGNVDELFEFAQTFLHRR